MVTTGLGLSMFGGALLAAILLSILLAFMRPR